MWTWGPMRAASCCWPAWLRAHGVSAARTVRFGSTPASRPTGTPRFSWFPAGYTRFSPKPSPARPSSRPHRTSCPPSDRLRAERKLERRVIYRCLWIGGYATSERCQAPASVPLFRPSTAPKRCGCDPGTMRQNTMLTKEMGLGRGYQSRQLLQEYQGEIRRRSVPADHGVLCAKLGYSGGGHVGITAPAQVRLPGRIANRASAAGWSFCRKDGVGGRAD